MLSLSQATVPVADAGGGGGQQLVSFPSEAAIVWTAVAAGCVAVVAIACVLTVDAKRVHVADREPVMGETGG